MSQLLSKWMISVSPDPLSTDVWDKMPDGERQRWMIMQKELTDELSEIIQNCVPSTPVLAAMLHQAHHWSRCMVQYSHRYETKKPGVQVYNPDWRETRKAYIRWRPWFVVLKMILLMSEITDSIMEDVL